MNRTKVATLGLLAPAALALGMSADTSFRFLGTALGITEMWERVLLCGVLEAAIVALTVYAWATRTKGPAYLAYGAVLIQAVPAFSVGGGAGGIVRVVGGPVLLAVLLHLLLGLELRMSGDDSAGILGQALREARERLTAYLGIGRRGADSEAIARSRAADRAVDLADRVEAAKNGSRAYRRQAAKLAAAIDDAQHNLTPEDADTARAAIVTRIVRRKSVRGLAAIDVRHDWTADLSPRNTEVPAAAVPARREVPALEAAPEDSEATAEQAPEQGTEHGSARTEHRPTPTAVDELFGPGPVRPEQEAAGSAGRNTPVPAAAVSAGQGPVLTVIRNSNGTRADHIRALVSHGVTGTGEIRDTLAAAGIPVPSDRYIRRLVSDARNAEVPATGTAGTHGYM